MAAVDKKSSVYLCLVVLEIRMHTYGEYEHVFRRKKSHMAAAAKERELAWGNIAAQVNV